MHDGNDRKCQNRTRMLARERQGLNKVPDKWKLPECREERGKGNLELIHWVKRLDFQLERKNMALPCTFPTGFYSYGNAVFLPKTSQQK